MNTKGNKSKKCKLCYLILLFFFLPAIAFAKSQPSPEGYWIAYDLNHVPRSVIKFSVVKGELIGTIAKELTAKNPGVNTVCNVCKGKWHDQPVIGLPIIWGLTQKKEGVWENGSVLDVDSGNVYHCKISVSEDNKILHFSPYLGMPLFGTTLDWTQAE